MTPRCARRAREQEVLHAARNRAAGAPASSIQMAQEVLDGDAGALPGGKGGKAKGRQGRARGKGMPPVHP